MAKMFHLRRDIRIRPTSVGNDDAGIVNDTSPAGAVHKTEGFGEKDLCLKTREPGIVLDKELPTVSQNKTGTLSYLLFSIQDDLVR